MIPAALIRLIEVADDFLRKKATIGELRRAVKAAQKAQGEGKVAPTNDRDGGHGKH